MTNEKPLFEDPALAALRRGAVDQDVIARVERAFAAERELLQLKTKTRLAAEDIHLAVIRLRAIENTLLAVRSVE